MPCSLAAACCLLFAFGILVQWAAPDMSAAGAGEEQVPGDGRTADAHPRQGHLHRGELPHVRLQRFCHGIGERHVAQLAALRRCEYGLAQAQLELLHDVDSPVLEVDFLDSQTEDFALAQPATCADIHTSSISLRHGFSHSEDALPRPRNDAARSHRGKADRARIARIAQDVPIINRRAEDRAHVREDDPSVRSGHPGFLKLGDEFADMARLERTERARTDEREGVQTQLGLH
jgi:hypothetical protein